MSSFLSFFIGHRKLIDLIYITYHLCVYIHVFTLLSASQIQPCKVLPHFAPFPICRLPTPSVERPGSPKYIYSLPAIHATKYLRINVELFNRLKITREVTFHEFLLTPSVFFVSSVVFKWLSKKGWPVLHQALSTSALLTFCAR